MCVCMCVYVCVCVCGCVCVCATALAATYLVCMSKVRHHRVPCRLLNICIVWTLLKCFVREIWRDLPDRLLDSFSTRNTLMVFDMTRTTSQKQRLPKIENRVTFFDCLGFKA